MQVSTCLLSRVKPCVRSYDHQSFQLGENSASAILCLAESSRALLQLSVQIKARAFHRASATLAGFRACLLLPLCVCLSLSLSLSRSL